MSAEGGARLYVGNLSWSTTGASLYEDFDKNTGTVVEAMVIIDHYSGRSRGFGFVIFDSPAQAAAARDNMDGVKVDGRTVHVEIASSQCR